MRAPPAARAGTAAALARRSARGTGVNPDGERPRLRAAGAAASERSPPCLLRGSARHQPPPAPSRRQPPSLLKTHASKTLIPASASRPCLTSQTPNTLQAPRRWSCPGRTGSSAASSARRAPPWRAQRRSCTGGRTRPQALFLGISNISCLLRWVGGPCGGQWRDTGVHVLVGGACWRLDPGGGCNSLRHARFEPASSLRTGRPNSMSP